MSRLAPPRALPDRDGFTLVEEYDELPWQHVMIFSPSP